MSSGITCPFGQLSQSPGYISDTLLTRSPLCIATPCDLHVLATPPAFRLSQNQTLQLNFLALLPPHARRENPRLSRRLLSETDSFGSSVYPRNESIRPDRIKTIRSGGYCLRVGWDPKDSPDVFFLMIRRPPRIARLKHSRW